MNFRKLDFVNMEKTCTKKIAGLFGQYERNYVHVPTARYNSVQFLSIIDDHSAENPTNDPTLEENPMSYFYVNIDKDFVASCRAHNKI